MGVMITLANVVFLCGTTYKLARAVDWATVNRTVVRTLSRVGCGKASFGQVPSTQLVESKSGVPPKQHASKA